MHLIHYFNFHEALNLNLPNGLRKLNLYYSLVCNFILAPYNFLYSFHAYLHRTFKQSINKGWRSELSQQPTQQVELD